MMAMMAPELELEGVDAMPWWPRTRVSAASMAELGWSVWFLLVRDDALPAGVLAVKGVDAMPWMAQDEGAAPMAELWWSGS